MRAVTDTDVIRAERIDDKWALLRFGLTASDLVDTEWHDTLYAYDDLPEKIRTALSVLNLVAPPPPINEVEGLGRRISEDIFWVYLKPE